MAVVKGVTKSGIKFQLDTKIKDDTRLLFLMTMAQKYDPDDKDSINKANSAMSNLLTLIFGSEENVLIFMNEVAAKHKGVCDAGHMISEITEMFDAIKGKN
jgi:hypothetical protein